MSSNPIYSKSNPLSSYPLQSFSIILYLVLPNPESCPWFIFCPPMQSTTSIHLLFLKYVHFFFSNVMVQATYALLTFYINLFNRFPFCLPVYFYHYKLSIILVFNLIIFLATNTPGFHCHLPWIQDRSWSSLCLYLQLISGPPTYLRSS